MTQQPSKDAPAPTPGPGLRFRSAVLSHRKPTRFSWQATNKERAALAEDLGLIAVNALRFKGEILPEGRNDFRLNARLDADVTQACVVTLAPVLAEISERISRVWLAEWHTPEGEEVEMPEDDSQDPLPETIDLIEVATEALALALPAWPRAPGAELGEQVFAAPGEEPLREEALKPFAGLASLLKKGDTPDGASGSDPQE